MDAFWLYVQYTFFYIVNKKNKDPVSQLSFQIVVYSFFFSYKQFYIFIAALSISYFGETHVLVG